MGSHNIAMGRISMCEDVLDQVVAILIASD